MKPNTLRDSRAGRAGERGSLPAAQRWTWSVGDRVQRRLDVFEGKSEMRHGVVTRRYSGYSATCSYYSELYDVRWDGWSEQHGFLSHDLDRDTSDDLGRLFARVHGGFGDALQARAHNVEDAIADVRELGGER